MGKLEDVLENPETMCLRFDWSEVTYSCKILFCFCSYYFYFFTELNLVITSLNLDLRSEIYCESVARDAKEYC